MNKLSVVINTRNAEKTLEKCLKSVRFADEIIIVDMESSDSTLSIAKKFTSKIFNHKNVGYADPARNFALKKAANNWVLVVDADEEISATLKKKINSLINTDSKFDIYLLPRKNLIFNKWIQHSGWWPDYQARLFRKGHVSWQVGVHRMPDLRGLANKLTANEDNALIHYNYDSINHFIEKMNHYTSIQAKERKSPANVTSLLVMNNFFNEFYRRFFKDSGYEDNTHGLSLALLQSMYELVILLKQWENDSFKEANCSDSDLEALIRNISPSLNYWLADKNVKKAKGVNKVYWMIRRKLKI